MSDTPTNAPTEAPAAPPPFVGETSFWLDGRLLLAAAKFVSDDETRNVLCGVCIVVRFETDQQDAEILLFATNGRAAVAMRVRDDGAPLHDLEKMPVEKKLEMTLDQRLAGTTSDSFIFPLELIKRIKPLTPKSEPKVQIEVQAGPKNGERRVLINTPISKRGVIGHTIEGAYPNLPAVFVETKCPLQAGRVIELTNMEPTRGQFFGAINTDYLADFSDMLDLLGHPSAVAIYRGGDCTSPLHLRPVTPASQAEIEAVVMPVRAGNEDDHDKTWERPDWLKVQPTNAEAVTLEAETQTEEQDKKPTEGTGEAGEPAAGESDAQ